MYEMVIIGAGPAGISMASEARVAGIEPEKILILERAGEHSFSLKKYYPDNKLVTANYKGFDAVCIGVMCIPDMTKDEAITYLDQTIREVGALVRYSETVFKIHKEPGRQEFDVWTDRGEYKTRLIVVAIGILGKPNKPEYKLPPSLKGRILFDMTTTDVSHANVLVVGGGDSASEYCQYLVQKGNTVTLSYRRTDFSRMNEINRMSILALGKNGDVEILYGSNVVEVKDAGGKCAVRFKEDEAVRTFDYIVYTLGGTTPTNFLKTIGIDYDGETPYVKEAGETNVPGMFLIGDLSAGTKGGSIIWAFNSASTAMKLIQRTYLIPQNGQTDHET